MDEDEFTALFRLHAERAYALAFRLCGDRGRAEDAVAEAFARVYVQWRAGRVQDPPAYVRRAVVNEVYGGFRRLRVERTWLERRHGDDRGALVFEEQAVDSDLFRRALATLPAGQRTAVVLRYWEGLSEAETAQAMGCTTGTVKTQVHRAVRALRATLSADRVAGGAP